MKKSVTISIATLLATITAATGQVAGGRVTIENLMAERRGETMEVIYTAVIEERAVDRDHTLMFAPVVAGGGFLRSLPAVTVHGPGSRFARQRREIALGTGTGMGTGAGTGAALVARNGQRLTLSATVPFQEWMYGADVVFECVEGGCCNTTRFDQVVVARGVLPRPLPPVVAAAAEPVWVPRSVGDSLSTAFPFVVPASEFDPAEPFKMYDDDRENALEVYFRLARYDIETDYLDNAYNLNNLIGCIDMIMASTDSRVERIVVGGFASPEGSAALNDRLAFERAVTLKQYIVDNTRIGNHRVAVFNGSVDWRGLRARIERSTMVERDELLALIDNTPVEGSPWRPGRLEALRTMNRGSTYSTLQAQHFPWLRTGAFIRVYYINTTQ